MGSARGQVWQHSVIYGRRWRPPPRTAPRRPQRPAAPRSAPHRSTPPPTPAHARPAPSVSARARRREEPRARAGGSAPPRDWEPRRRRGGGAAGCEWSGHFLFLRSFPQLWVVAAAGLQLPAGAGRGGVDRGPGIPRLAARSRVPARLPRPEPVASRRSARPPRPRERPRCRPSSVWWWETGECGAGAGAGRLLEAGVGTRVRASVRACGPRSGRSRGALAATPPWDPAARPWFRLFFSLFGGGGNRRRRPEGKVNSTLRFLPAPADHRAEATRRRSATLPRSPGRYVGLESCLY